MTFAMGIGIAFFTGLLLGFFAGMLAQSVFDARVERRQREDPSHRQDSLD